MQTSRAGLGQTLLRWPRLAGRYGVAGVGSAAVCALPMVRAAWPGADPCAGSRRAAVYVSYSRWSLVSDYVVAQVASLAATGRRVIFITHSRRLCAADLTRLQPYVAEVLHRRNFGHDFGAYKDGVARLDRAALDSLILMNDSCYGPFGGLDRVEAAALASGADLFGITDSWDIGYHLQTYFVWIGPRALRAPAFGAFWRTLLPSQPRSLVIANGEVRFTRKLLRAGLRAAALCPYTEAAARAQAAAQRALDSGAPLPGGQRAYLENLADGIMAGTRYNPTHSFWNVLLSECGSPFVKRELLRMNPVGIPGVAHWERVVAAQPGADLDIIRNDLKLG